MKKFPVTILPRAQNDLINIWGYISKKSQDTEIANDFSKYLLSICNDTISLLPEMGRKREDLKKGLRYHPVGKYNYLIFYSIRDDKVLIESIIQDAKNYKNHF